MSFRLLLVLPQWPRDPASGAVRSLSTIARLLARHGISVRALATTATEGSRNIDVQRELAEAGIVSSVQKGRTGRRNRPELTYDDHGVPHRLLDVAHRKAFAWEETLGREFDLMFDEELASFKPDVMLTFGGTAGDIRRRQRARRQGVRVVFGLRNNGYLDAHSQFWESIDEILTPSSFLTDLYRTRQHIESTPIPSPFDIDDIIAEERDPIFFTMVNPSPEKGLMLFARLAEECSKRRPDITFLVVESRAGQDEC